MLDVVVDPSNDRAVDDDPSRRRRCVGSRREPSVELFIALGNEELCVTSLGWADDNNAMGHWPYLNHTRSLAAPSTMSHGPRESLVANDCRGRAPTCR